MDIYRIGGPTHKRWVQDMAEIDMVITENDALVTDPEDGWVGVDPTRLPEGVADLYQGLRQLGFWHGWIAA
jgi:hypothetical protein